MENLPFSIRRLLPISGKTARRNSLLSRVFIATMENGIKAAASRHSVAETVRRIEEILKSRGIRLFALVDHSGEAERVGMHMRPTKLLIFGNPNAGTPRMIAAPSIAIDLPLKALIWEDGDGSVWISYNAASYLQSRHGLPDDSVKVLGSVEALAKEAAGLL